jgi:hypothetical protein
MKLHGLALACVLVLASVSLARQGVVITQDGQRFPGDVSEQATSVRILQRDAKGNEQRVDISKANVKDIVYADQVAEQVRQQRQRLDRRDVQGRIGIAQFAMQNNAYESARDVLEEAQQIEPNNQQVKDLLKTVNAQIRMQRGETPQTQPTGAASQPTTEMATGATGATATTRPAMVGPQRAVRMVTAEEINRIRQIEWDRKEPVRVRVDQGVRQRFLAAHANISQAEFSRGTPLQQAALILDQGNPDLFPGIHILTDPATISTFKTRVQRVLTGQGGCAATGCHAGPNAKGGSFFLFTPANTEAATYSNFLILQKYAMNVKNVQRLMVDREFPDKSLLLQFMLPVNVGDPPHPEGAANFRPLVKMTTDVRFRQVSDWIRSLAAVLPDYGVDLSQEAPPADKPNRTGGPR